MSEIKAAEFGERLSFIDIEQYLQRKKAMNSLTNDPTMNKEPIKETKDPLHDHKYVDSDHNNYHGTNVTTFAAGALRGAAPAAKVVSIRIGDWNAIENKFNVFETWVIDALNIVQDARSKSNTHIVVNCSFSFTDKNHEAATLKKMCTLCLVNQIHIVAAIGNDGVSSCFSSYSA